MITEDYVSFEIAKLLKEKGFNEMTELAYELEDGHIRNDLPVSYWRNSEIGKYKFSCPTHQMAMAWLRETHHICITIYPDKTKGYEAVLYDTKDDVEIILQSFGVYGSRIFRDSYEKAVEAALMYCLENCLI